MPRRDHTSLLGPELRTLFARYRRIRRDVGYYHVALGLDGAKGVEWHVPTQWKGWADAEHRIERRVARPIDPHWMVECWRQSAVPYFVVNDAVGLAVFLSFGGMALIAIPVAERHLSDVINKRAMHETATGFRVETGVDDAPRMRSTANGRTSRRPRPRCDLCAASRGERARGRLHIRPIRAPAIGGTPAADNFVALCPSCDAQLWNGALDALPDSAPHGSDPNSPYLEMRRYRDWLKNQPAKFSIRNSD